MVRSAMAPERTLRPQIASDVDDELVARIVRVAKPFVDEHLASWPKEAKLKQKVYAYLAASLKGAVLPSAEEADGIGKRRVSSGAGCACWGSCRCRKEGVAVQTV